MQNLDSTELKCIKVDFDGNMEYINWNTFNKSYLGERWVGERRYENRLTLWGMAHRKMTVKSPDNKRISRRWFTFPKSMHEAKELHKLNS